MRWFIDLSYRGASFHGWQVQPGVVTVQSVIEGALERLRGCPVAITGAGRTDAGVNARRMIAHVDFPDEFDPREGTFLRSLNALCGPDIAIRSIWPVAPDAHARFDAVERSYRYFVHTAKDPFASGLSWQAPASLDFELMNEAANAILGRRDFTSFSKLHTDVKTNICDLRSASWQRIDESHWYFEIVADRFLRNMVRAIVGTLVDVGRGRYTCEEFRAIVASRDLSRSSAGAPAQGLFLSDIRYPAEVFERTTGM